MSKTNAENFAFLFQVAVDYLMSSRKAIVEKETPYNVDKFSSLYITKLMKHAGAS